ncbi:MAG TPA: DUF4349 domain-containing protein [Streptosporangiaceae bacterium]|nr:DUF4349 domain-containing protein [Streptosporangiaceae bacterium]
MSSSHRTTGSISPRSLLIVIATCAGTGLLVTACAASSHSSGTSGTAAEPRANAPVAGPAFGVAGASGAERSAHEAIPSTNELTKLAPVQSIIYTSNVTLRVKNVTAVATTATNDATTAGGYVASEQQTIPNGRHGVAQVSLQLKIPVTVYHATLTTLASLGHPLAYSTQAQDVTQQVADVSSQAASAQAAIRQLRALLSRAGNVGQLLSVQDEINNEESSLEALLAQQQALAHETSYGTVYLTLVGHHAATVIKRRKTHHGLVAGLATGWHALRATVVWLLTVLGTVLPFAVALAVLLGLGYLGRRRLLRRRASPTAPPAPAS